MVQFESKVHRPCKISVTISDESLKYLNDLKEVYGASYGYFIDEILRDYQIRSQKELFGIAHDEN